MSQPETTKNLPNIQEALSGILQRVPQDRQPLLIAFAERMAADRYRGWANQVNDPSSKKGLVACADREDEIARRIESLYPNWAAIQSEIVASTPDLSQLTRSLFEPLALHDQFALQAQGERLGAATWRSLARQTTDPNAAEMLSGCAALEEESAVFLESLLVD